MANALARAFAAVHRAIYRLSRGRVAGKMGGLGILMLETVGRKSGQARNNLLCYARDGEHYVLIASKGGAPAHPAWYLNLRANPHAHVTIGSETFDVHSHDAPDSERERLWRLLADRFPGYDKYQAKTAREIPVVVLTPESRPPS